MSPPLRRLLMNVASLLVAGTTFTISPGSDFGTLRDRSGAIMRGTPVVLGRSLPEAVAFAEDPATWALLRTNGFNTVRVCWVDPWYRDRSFSAWTVAEVLPHLDLCVQRGAEAGMNVIINYHNVGEQQNGVSLSFVAEFWEAVAARYKDEPHVYYELTNEPTFNGSQYLQTPFRTDLLAIYHQVRTDAPEREILMFSFNSTGLDMAGIVAAYADAIDWDHTSIAFHLYGGDGTSTKVRALMQQYRLICTEWDYPGRWDYVPVVDGDAINSQTLERLGCSWTDWHDWGDTNLDRLFNIAVPDAEAKGYWWADHLGAPVDGNLVNLSARALAGVGERALIVGYITTGANGGNLPVLLRGIGPSLRTAPFNVTNAVDDPMLTLFLGSTPAGDNNNWGGNPALRTLFQTLNAFAIDDASLDAALLRTNPDPEAVTVHLSPAPDTTEGVGLAELYDAAPTPGATTNPIHLVNLSARAQVGGGSAILIGGFVITGNVPRRILIRGIGPTLGFEPFNLLEPLLDPELRLYRADGSFLQGNDDWGGASALDEVFTSTGAFPLPDAASRDAAMILTLPPGQYTVHLSGKDGTTGVALLEIYEAS